MLRRTAVVLAGVSLASCGLVTGGLPGATGGMPAVGPSTGGATGVSSGSSAAAHASSSASTTTTTTAGAGGGLANPTCADGIKDGMETDVDCGSDACPPCPLGGTCKVAADCGSGTCTAGRCAPTMSPPCTPVMAGSPSCHDCTKNGTETDADCGGDACPPCALGKACLVDADCATGNCLMGVCAPAPPVCQPVDPNNPSCADCVTNGSETDVDCGGDACSPCALGEACLVDTDCTTGNCAMGVCAPLAPMCQPVDPSNPSCADCVKDGSETDIDCGGDACPPCEAAKACANGSDCSSGVCASGTCHTGAKGTPCLGASDCTNHACSPGNCWTGRCCG